MIRLLPLQWTPVGAWSMSRSLGPSGWLAGVFLLWLLLAACMPAWFAADDPREIAPHQAFQPPSLTHYFGTDAAGRDVYTRVIYGTRASLLIGLGSTACAFALALPLGLLAGLSRGWPGRLADAGLEVLFAFPVLVLALIFVAVFGSGLGPLILATGVGCAPGYARLVRGQAKAVRMAAYVQAGRALGHSPWRLLWQHILPNTMSPLAVTVMMGVGQTIVWASALSFLGLGQPPPAAEWGTMLAMGRDFVVNAWWLCFFPGALIVLTALATTLLGRQGQARMSGRPA